MTTTPEEEKKPGLLTRIAKWCRRKWEEFTDSGFGKTIKNVVNWVANLVRKAPHVAAGVALAAACTATALTGSLVVGIASFTGLCLGVVLFSSNSISNGFTNLLRKVAGTFSGYFLMMATALLLGGLIVLDSTPVWVIGLLCAGGVAMFGYLEHEFTVRWIKEEAEAAGYRYELVKNVDVEVKADTPAARAQAFAKGEPLAETKELEEIAARIPSFA